MAPNVASRTGCTFSRTTSIPRSSTPKTGGPLPDGAGRRTGAHHAQQAGDADDPLPHARHHRRSSRSPARAAARSAASAASGAAATTCSSSAASTSSRRRSRPRCWQVEGTLPHYQIILTRDKGLDQMEVQVEVTPELFSDRVGRSWRNCKASSPSTSSAACGLRVLLSLVEPHSLAPERRQGETGHRSTGTVKAVGRRKHLRL